MSTRESWNRWARGVTVALAVLALVCPAVAYDAGGTFARGTMILGLQIGGGAANNTEGHRTVSDISFLTAALRVSCLFFPPFGSGLLRSAVEPGIEGWFRYYLSPHEATAQGLKLAMRYHLIGFGRLVPYLAGTAGAGGHEPPGEGDRLHVHVRARGRSGAIVLRHGHGRVERGLSPPAHLERAHLEPEPGLQLRLGSRRRFVLLQVRGS